MCIEYPWLEGIHKNHGTHLFPVCLAGNVAGCLVCDECFGKSYTQRLFMNKVRLLAILVMQGRSLSSQLSCC